MLAKANTMIIASCQFEYQLTAHDHFLYSEKEDDEVVLGDKGKNLLAIFPSRHEATFSVY